MDFDTNTMTQDTENLVDPPKTVRLRGASMRKKTGIIQVCISLVVAGLGVTILLLRPPLDLGHLDGIESSLRVIDNTAPGVWGAADTVVLGVHPAFFIEGYVTFFQVFVITGVVGIFSNKTKNMVSLYLALCLFSSLVAGLGIGSSVCSIVFSVEFKRDSSYRCRNSLARKFHYNEVECCVNQYDCQYSSEYDSDEDYYGQRCEKIRKKYESCRKEEFATVNPRMVLYAIAFTVFVLEVFFSILGAGFTCIGICDCKKKQQSQEQRMPQLYFQLGAFGQLPRPAGTSTQIPPSDLTANGLPTPSVMMLDTAGQPVQMTNHPVLAANPSPVQMIPVAQGSLGQIPLTGQLMLVNSGGHVIPHMSTPISSSQMTPPSSYALPS